MFLNSIKIRRATDFEALQILSSVFHILALLFFINDFHQLRRI